MKKLLILVLAFSISMPLFAALKEKHLIGKWKYKVEIDEGNMTVVFQFEKKDGMLVGTVHTNDGYSMPISKIEIKDNDKLYLEINTDQDNYKINLKLDGESFKGTGSSYSGEAPITGEKIE